MDRWLLILGCLVFVSLGVLHLAFTVFTPKFEASEPQVTAEMKRVSPILTSHTSMWKTWVGVHLSHSIALMLFGILYIVIALENYPYLRSSAPLNIVLLTVPLLYFVLSVRYWFEGPRNGVLVGLVLIVLSCISRLVTR